MSSPYDKVDTCKWSTITEELIEAHPLEEAEIVDVVSSAMRDINNTTVGEHLKAGANLVLNPQIVGCFMDQLILYWLNKKQPNLWKEGETKSEKDLVYLPDNSFSIEIKSTSQKRIVANRSYALGSEKHKKKSGYYLAIIFSKMVQGSKSDLQLIKFGWLDQTDWSAQVAQTGQKASLKKTSWDFKLKTLYDVQSRIGTV